MNQRTTQDTSGSGLTADWKNWGPHIERSDLNLSRPSYSIPALLGVGSTAAGLLLLAVRSLSNSSVVSNDWHLVAAVSLVSGGLAVLGLSSLHAWGRLGLDNRSSKTSISQVGKESLPVVALGKVLQSLASTAEARDSQTYGHCERVADDSVAIGKVLGLSNEELDTLFWAALLHDVGKMAVAESVLTKSGRLTSDELDEIRRHPGYGADLVLGISPHLVGIAEAIRAHHERWDGRGYPLGISGNRIPLLARIISVTDVYEALTSPRPYREPLRPEQAAVYIRRGSGTQFDPVVVGAFERLHATAGLATALPRPEPSAAPIVRATAPMDGLTS